MFDVGSHSSLVLEAAETTFGGEKGTSGILFAGSVNQNCPTQRRLPQESREGTLPRAISANWYNLKDAGLSPAIFGRLLKDAIRRSPGDGRGFAPLHEESLRTFLKFWKTIRDIAKEPALSITPQGNIVAEWYRDRRNFLAMQFAFSGSIHFSYNHQAFPLSGARPSKAFADLRAIMVTPGQNPFQWSDAHD